jgi:hypothetical protein
VAEEEAPISAAPNTPPMPHVLASQSVAAPLADAGRSHAPQPTVREPALERRQERDQRVGMQTLQLGTALREDALRESDPAAAANSSPLATLSSSQRQSSGGTQPLAMRGSSPSLDTPGASAASKTLRGHEDPGSSRGRGEVVHEALHDDFFDAGDQGMYDAGHEVNEHHVLDDELEHDVPRVIVRTPEQEQRRARLMQVVGVVVGVVLGVFVFAVLRGRGHEEPKAPLEQPEKVEPPVQVAPPPEPAPITPPPPPPVEPVASAPPVVEAIPEPPAEPEKTADKPPVVATPKPAAPREPAPVVAAPRPRPETAPTPARPAAPVQPKGPTQPKGPATPPSPAGKPPTVSFPD